MVQTRLGGRQCKAGRQTGPKRRRQAPRSSAMVMYQQPSLRDKQYYDFDVSQTLSSAISYTSVFQPLAGTSASSRYGDKTLAHTVKWSLFSTTVGSAAMIRLMLIYDEQPNGANPSSPEPLAAVNVHSFKNAYLRDRYKVIRDWTIPLNPAASYGNDTKHDGHQKGLAKLNLVSQFNGAAGTIADVKTGSFIFLAFSDAGTPSITGKFRFLFSS